MLNFKLKSALKFLFGQKANTEASAENHVATVAAVATTGQEEKDQKAEIELPVSLTIWTIERKRYASARALCTDIEVYPSTAVDLCEGIQAYLLGTPNGESVVVEAKTGGLIGHALEVVLDGIREMTPNQLLHQIDTAKKEFNRMKKQEMPNDEFWKSIQMGTEEFDAAQE
jgi:hypothetical protein